MIPDNAPVPALRMGVVIVSYHRAELLRNCLASLSRQDHLPDQVVVAGVQGDTETRAVVEAFEQASRIACIWVASPMPSVADQTNRGVEASDCDIIAFTNDDAEPYPDWLARMEPYYADPTVGGVGGRDFIHKREGGVIDGPTDCVGAITWFGRVHGNHHLSYPHVVDVDVLKGVNMSCRKTLYRPIDSRLAQGGQRHWEIDLCLTVRAAGYRLVYDPAICVDHYHFGADRAPVMRPEYIYANSHNLTLCQVKHRSGWKRVAFVTYDLLWGDLPEMGLAVFLRTYLKQLRAGGDVGFIRLLGVSMTAKRDALTKLVRLRSFQVVGEEIA